MNLQYFLSKDLIFWDFDGVILDSMAIRDKGFEHVLEHHKKEDVEQLLTYHRKNGGLSRYVKFRYFYENIIGITITEEKVRMLADQFSIVMRELLTDRALLIQDSVQFIEKYYRTIPMHIVSGSDHNELNYLCNELNIAQYFISLNGSPVPKKTLVRNILKTENPTEGNVVLIGDSINDYDAAVSNKIEFAGYNNQSLKKYSEIYIPKFRLLKS